MTQYPIDIPELPPEAWIDRLVSLLAPLERVLQPKLHGVERLPVDGSLLVGNHTIYGFLDLPFMMAEIWKRRGSPSVDLASTPTTRFRSGAICWPRAGWFAVRATTSAP